MVVFSWLDRFATSGGKPIKPRENLPIGIAWLSRLSPSSQTFCSRTGPGHTDRRTDMLIAMLRSNNANEAESWQYFVAVVEYRLSILTTTVMDYYYNKYVRLRDWCISTHTDPTSTGRAISRMAHLYRDVYVGASLRLCLHAGGRGPGARRFVRFWASGGAKFAKMGDSLPWTPMNRREKFDAASFILGGEIRNRTNTHNTHTRTQRKINSNRYIHTLPIGMCG